MRLIDTTDELAAFCRAAAEFPYVTVDTEFMRDRSYYSRLCLIQMALPEDSGACPALVDTLAPDISLEPVFELFQNHRVVKVFHAARQDLEIFFQKGEVFPEPLFDTQIAAMVCGFGEQASYGSLASQIAGASLDKSSQITDWSRRPLTERQMEYAISDVTHLRKVYLYFRERLSAESREGWVEEETATLMDPALYSVDPKDAWLRVKASHGKGPYRAILRELARFREEFAQARDIPRGWVFKDDALLELASLAPDSHEALQRSRRLRQDSRRGAVAAGIVSAVKKGLACPPQDFPQAPEKPRDRPKNAALADLLKVLLKAKSEEFKVASKLVATSPDLERIAAGERDLPVFTGWRRRIFGDVALRLCDGEIALSARGNSVQVIPAPPDPE